jgi:DNA-binding transcriptional LysR family regulator
MFDLNLLLVFEAMLIHQNVSTAAAHNGFTQSAMSNALGRLRREVGDPLFVNTHSGMLPTPRALELAKPIQQALALVRASMEKPKGFDPRQSRRTFRISMTDVGEMVFLPSLVKRLDESGATIELETVQLPVSDIPRQLESGEIDLAAGYFPSLAKSIERDVLFREHYVCLARRSHPLAKGGVLHLKDFLAGSHVLIESLGSGHKIIERKLKDEGIKRDVSLRIPHFSVVPMIVASTDRIVTVPSRVANILFKQVKVQVLPLPIKIPSFDVSLFWHTRFADDLSIQWLRGLMAELFHEPRGAKETRP